MGRTFKHYLPLGPEKTPCGYSYKRRGDYLAVVFAGPDGGRIEKMTKCKKPDQNFVLEVSRLMVRAYQKQYPAPNSITWDEVEAGLGDTTVGLRPNTVLAFEKAIKALRLIMLESRGPGDITPDLANRFGKTFLSTTFKRGKASDSKSYKRSPVTLSYYVRSLSALWSHLQADGKVTTNPWTLVRKVKLDRQRKAVPTEADVTSFFGWVKAKYPTWTSLHLLLELKAETACRTLDVCQLRSDQLRDGRLHFDAKQVKNKESRHVLLRPDLYEQLKRVAGPRQLWESFASEAQQHRPSKNSKATTPYWIVNNLFREWSEQHPDRPRLTPHALRRRAITLAVQALGGNVDMTAQGLGVTPHVVRTCYLDAQRAMNSDEVFAKVAEVLRPKTPPAIPPLKGNNQEQ